MTATWDPDRPGCAPETCGGTSYDPCVTVLCSRGRWHDGAVPATATDAVTQILAGHHWWDGVCWNNRIRICGVIPDDDAGWRAHVAPLVAAAVADWLRCAVHPYSPAARWAAGVIDNGGGS